jgi:hypothetical protein
MTDENENIGKTADEYNPRFLQYARWRGMTPEAVLAADQKEYPGGKMAGFMLWNDERIAEWCREVGVSRHWSSVYFTEISEWIDKQLAAREKDQDYLKGNTRELAAEWGFSFVASRARSNGKIPEAEVAAFWDKVLDAADEHGFALGGSFKPITDADYEAMDREDEDG